MLRKILMAAVVLAVSGSMAHAGVTGLFNTGVNATGAVLADGTIGDPHYSIIAAPSGVTTIMTRTGAGGFPIPPWIGDDASSSWIGPANDAILDGPVGVFDYQTTFTVSGATPHISGRWSTDDAGVDILVNGVSTLTTAAGFTSWSPFSLTSGFTQGTNTLGFLVFNYGGPTGLRVEITSVPEPATWALMLLGVGAVGFSMRRSRKVLAPA